MSTSTPDTIRLSEYFPMRAVDMTAFHADQIWRCKDHIAWLRTQVSNPYHRMFDEHMCQLNAAIGKLKLLESALEGQGK